MIETRSFHLTSDRNAEGVVYSYRKSDGVFCGLEIKAALDIAKTCWIKDRIHLVVDDFIHWAQEQKGSTLVELQQLITFAMFWDKYNDKLRSSKKRSEKIWSKMTEADQVKAYYFYDKYNRNRGTAEKKYCETYLAAEMWNN